MRKLETIESEISELKDDEEKLQSVKTLFSNLSHTIGTISRDLMAVGRSIKEAGDIYGLPFDNGKAEEKSKDYIKIRDDVNNVCALISRHLGEIDNQLEALEKERQAVISALEKKKQENQNTEKETNSKSKTSKGSKNLLININMTQ